MYLRWFEMEKLKFDHAFAEKLTILSISSRYFFLFCLVFIEHLGHRSLVGWLIDGVINAVSAVFRTISTIWWQHQLEHTWLNMYGGILLPPICKINYVNMRENYVNMRLFYVNIHIFMLTCSKIMSTCEILMSTCEIITL